MSCCDIDFYRLDASHIAQATAARIGHSAPNYFAWAGRVREELHPFEKEHGLPLTDISLLNYPKGKVGASDGRASF